MPLGSGANIAGYRVIRLLGSGGMGEVYLVQHPRLPRRDALKVLPADVSADPDYRARFNREADLVSTLWHPHIVGVHDRGEYEGQLWISMDFVDGVDAGRLLTEQYPAGMPPGQVAEIVAAVASALDYAHKQGLLHRDVKPANIMLTQVDDEGKRRALLTDFGIARDLDDVSGLTMTNMTVGTIAYSAPEQLMGETVDGRADQYALAATAYRLLTGAALFPHSNAAVVITHHLNSVPLPVSAVRPELFALDWVLSKALSKSPQGRFIRCGDFARAFTDQVHTPSPPLPSAPTAPAPIPLAHAPQATSVPTRAERNIPLKWILPVGAAALALGVGATVLVWQSLEDDSVATETSTVMPSTTSTTTTTTRVPPPPAPPSTPSPTPTPVSDTSPENAFIGALNGQGVTWPGATPANMVAAGRGVCTDWDAGATFDQEVASLTPHMSAEDAAFLIGASTAAFCPQYEWKVQ
ncbi:serine/threonine-protein kinase [Mycobacterium sp. NPDC051804]|uniref:serine/threonine-protein kinase n=1 Tax=Mycobacterium sp. NPDC051804 TaxID=3364295 RepID=UPI0037B1920D